MADRFACGPGIEWRNVSGEVVALDLESSAYLSVNDTGSVLWPLVASGTTRGGLVDELLARFDVDADEARRDVAEFVEQLRSFVPGGGGRLKRPAARRSVAATSPSARPGWPSGRGSRGAAWSAALRDRRHRSDRGHRARAPPSPPVTATVVAA